MRIMKKKPKKINFYRNRRKCRKTKINKKIEAQENVISYQLEFSTYAHIINITHRYYVYQIYFFLQG